MKALRKIPQIEAVHDLHLWSLDGDANIGSCHIVTKATSDLDLLKHKIRDCFEKYHIQHVTIELEQELDHCPHKNC